VPPEIAELIRGRHRFSKLVRYGTASFVTTILSLALIAVLLVDLTPAMANLVAVGVGSVISFELNRRWVWRQDESRFRWRQPLLFVAVSVLFLAVSTLAVKGVENLFVPAHAGMML
jgi:putative flippase GtrA